MKGILIWIMCGLMAVACVAYKSNQPIHVGTIVLYSLTGPLVLIPVLLFILGQEIGNKCVLNCEGVK